MLVSILAEVALNYTELRTLQRRRSLTQEELANQKEVLAIVMTKFDNGAITELDVDRAKSNAASTQSQIPSPVNATEASNGRG